MKSWVKVVVLSGMVIMLSGCFGDGAPECDSKEAKKLVKQIAKKTFSGVLKEEALDAITLENITTDGINKELKVSRCSVEGILNGEKFRGRWKYKLSITSDGKLYAEVNF